MEEALPGMEADKSDIVLMDLGLPGMSGLEGIRRLKQANPARHLVALTVYEDDDRIFEAPSCRFTPSPKPSPRPSATASSADTDLLDQGIVVQPWPPHDVWERRQSR
jgi:CheY-like chemotaxis protein